MTEVTCKAPVSALQEYLMKKGNPPPQYEFSEIIEEGGIKSFHCIVSALNEIADGTGRSKREAKHEAADNILKKFQGTDSKVRYNPQAQMPTVDAISELRYMCIQRNCPFPQFEIVQEIAPPSPEFTCKCSIASIVRYGTSSTKKWARQLAAQAIIDVIQAIPIMDTLSDLIEYKEEDNRSKFKIYKEAIESDAKDQPGVFISERHNYFKNLQDDIKTKALQNLNDTSFFQSPEDKVDLVLKALGIKYKKSEIPCTQGPNMLFIELICDMDVVFAGDRNDIFDEMLEYFKVMLL